MEETESIDLRSSRGDRLAGVLHWPAAPHEPRGLVVVSPCFTCGKDIAPVRSLARDLAAGGFLACRFDPWGNGKSEGRFEEATISRHRDDLVAVARSLAARASPLHLAGHSLGGVVSLLAAREAGARSVATLASDARPDAFHRLFGEDAARALSSGKVGFDAGDGVIRPLTRTFLEDFERQDALGEAARLGALLVVHGDADEVVPLEAARALVARAGPRARLEVVPGGAHLLSRREDRERIRAAMLDFLQAPAASA